MTLYTALVISDKDNDIRCEPGSRDKKTGWYGAEINLYHDGLFHTCLVSSEPVYGSIAQAVADMEDIVEKVRGLNLLDRPRRAARSGGEL